MKKAPKRLVQILSVKTDPIKLLPPESDLDRKTFVSGRGSAKQIRFQNSLTAVMFFSCKEGNLFREKVICVRKIDYFALEAELKFKRKKEIKMPQNIVLRQEESELWFFRFTIFICDDGVSELVGAGSIVPAFDAFEG